MTYTVLMYVTVHGFKHFFSYESSSIFLPERAIECMNVLVLTDDGVNGRKRHLIGLLISIPRDRKLVKQTRTFPHFPSARKRAVLMDLFSRVCVEEK